jgi:hypothetical protein
MLDQCGELTAGVEKRSREHRAPRTVVHDICPTRPDGVEFLADPFDVIGK